LLHISSLDDMQKNVSGILRAFQAALKENPDMELSIVGEGEDKQTLERLVERLKIKDKVKFKGAMFSGDLVNEINSHHGLVIFSNYETFCLVIIETFACGKPVITSNT